MRRTGSILVLADSFTSTSVIRVHNYANKDMVNGDVEDSDQNVPGGICGVTTTSATPAKLEVGPCKVPSWVPGSRGPYWVVAVGPGYEWALVSGGQPTHETPNGCRTGTGVNGSGLWIFTRSNVRDEAVINHVKDIAKSLGYDTTVLKSVQHENCTYALQ